MNGLTVMTLLHIGMLTSSASEYQQAFDQAEAAGAPFLVLVGKAEDASWRKMKEQTVPEAIRAGVLQSVVFTDVEMDDIPSLTRQLLRSEDLPQLVLYTPVGELWRRTHISGNRSVAEVRAFLRREIANGEVVADKTTVDEQAETPVQAGWMSSYSTGGT